MTEVVTMGESLIDFVPKQVDCRLKEVSDFHRAPGGASANVAVGLSRLILPFTVSRELIFFTGVRK